MEWEVFEVLWRPYRHELTRDWVSLSEIARRVEREMPDPPEAEVRATTLALIEEALRRGEAAAGTAPISGNGLSEVWDEAPQEAVIRIDRAWRALDHPLQPGDVVWFQRRS